MKILSFNVNGINAAKQHGLLEFIAKENSDIMCFQEIKANQETIDSAMLKINGYSTFPFYSQMKGHHGTICYTKQKPISVTYGIQEQDADYEGRVITLEFPMFFLVNVYVPNAGRGLPRLNYKLVFNEKFQNYCTMLRNKKHTIICGDLNVAHQEIDLANPKQNERNAGFTIEERNSFTKFLDLGYIDTFRVFVKERGHYTWWSQRSNAKARNIGWRLDYFLINREFESSLLVSEILQDIELSDHCPIRLVIKD